MSKIIASTYEVLEKIGEGGGGIVYKARHLRLNKDVVIKADKRSLSVGLASLSREVDLLKKLHHTYIPQVYDFFTENGFVYTVIDYIPGKSLDQLLAEDKGFSQPQLVEWTCELLEALIYLHGQTPGILHADIKPSNIMVTPEGDIRLIDFNISLLLNDSGAVRVGYSWGYASPEHYGTDYRGSGKNGKTRKATSGREKTVPLRNGSASVTVPLEGEREHTQPLGDSRSGRSTTVPLNSGRSSGRGTGNKSESDQHKERTVLLDVRSDIYSLGATLYHLASGVRPANDAMEVEPLRPGEISAEFCRIINKAMEPDPDRRYQTAADMLYDMERLHRHDPRTRRLNRVRNIGIAVLALLLLAGGGLMYLGLQQAKRIESHRVLAEQAQTALRQGDPVLAVKLAASALPEKLSLMDPICLPEAQSALTSALGVYDLSNGFKGKSMPELTAEALKAVLSPKGEKLCAFCAWEMSVFDTRTGERLAVLPAEPSALAEAVFLNEDRLAYAAPGALRVYDLSAGRELWHGEAATGIALSADGSTLAAVYKDDDRAYIYNAVDGELRKTVSFGGKRMRMPVNDAFADIGGRVLALNGDGSLLAVSFEGGGLYVYDLVGDTDYPMCENTDYIHFEGGFFGHCLAFSAYVEGKSALALYDAENDWDFLGSLRGTVPFRLQVDETGIYLARDNLLVQLDPETLTDRELAFADKAIRSFCHAGDYTVVTTEDKHILFYDRGAGEVAMDRVLADYSCEIAALAEGVAVVGSLDSPRLRILRLEDHPEAEVLSYDPAYPHSEARLSVDGETVMLFRFDRFRILRMDGTVVCDVALPDGNTVYDQQFRRENGQSWLEVVWYDGMVRRYSAADGSLLGEEQGAAPDTSLYEEFFTARYRITSPLHGTPTAYDRETGTLVKELEKDAYMTYVTEMGEYIITEYTTTQGERYGLLLNGDLETLAVLPDLCDALDGRLIFDYSSGHLREGRIYSLAELLALAGR